MRKKSLAGQTAGLFFYLTEEIYGLLRMLRRGTVHGRAAHLLRGGGQKSIARKALRPSDNLVAACF